jgi:hypothetical protein
MRPRRWLALALTFVLPLVLSLGLSTLVACDPGAENEARDSAPAAAPTTSRAEPEQPPTRRILPNCDAVKAARAATPAVGSPARLRFLWDGTPPQAIPRDIPVLVKEARESSDPPAVVIEIAPIPERDDIVEITQESGHLRVESGEILIDPCSAHLFLN